MRTARVTAAQNDWWFEGVHNRRALGWYSNPLKLLCSSLVPAVSETLSRTIGSSYCTNPL